VENGARLSLAGPIKSSTPMDQTTEPIGDKPGVRRANGNRAPVFHLPSVSYRYSEPLAIVPR
jgi:hypothetical protein